MFPGGSAAAGGGEGRKDPRAAAAVAVPRHVAARIPARGGRVVRYDAPCKQGGVGKQFCEVARVKAAQWDREAGTVRVEELDTAVDEAAGDDGGEEASWEKKTQEGREECAKEEMGAINN